MGAIALLNFFYKNEKCKKKVKKKADRGWLPFKKNAGAQSVYCMRLYVSNGPLEFHNTIST